MIFEEGQQVSPLLITPPPLLITSAEPVETITTPAVRGEKGDKGEPGSGANFVFDEILTGTINNSNATFSTVHDFIPETVSVSINGLTQRRGVDFNTSGNRTILFSESALVGDSLQVDYQRS